MEGRKIGSKTYETPVNENLKQGNIARTAKEVTNKKDIFKKHSYNL